MKVSITVHEIDEATAGRLLHTLADMGLAEESRPVPIQSGPVGTPPPLPPSAASPTERAGGAGKAPAAAAFGGISDPGGGDPERSPGCPQHGLEKRKKSKWGDGYYCSARVSGGYCEWRWPPPKGEGLTQRLRANGG